MAPACAVQPSPVPPAFMEAHHVPTLCRRPTRYQAFYTSVLQQSGQVDLLPLCRRELLPQVRHDSTAGTPCHPTGLICADLGAGSVFNLRWFILWNWRSIRNFSGCSIHLSVPLREREMVSIFNLGKSMFFVCEKDSTRQRAGAWRVEGSDKYRLPSYILI